MMVIFDIGNKLGDVSLIFYLLTLLPGTGMRFGIKNNFLSLLRIYRRYIGIAMYLLALSHVLLVKIAFAKKLQSFLPEGLFEVMGFTAIMILLFLFITSNDFSLRILHTKWYLIHRLTYFAMFFIFLHVALVSFGFWTILMGTYTIVQLLSFYILYRNKKLAAPIS